MRSDGVPHLALLGSLFDSLPLGVIVLDPEGRVVVFNRAEEQLAGRSRDRVLGADFFADVAPCMNVRQLGGLFRERIGQTSFDETVEMEFPYPYIDRPRDVRVRMGSLDFSGTPYGFLLVEDISMQREVERMREKLQSLLVHDLKNPLTSLTVNLHLIEELESVRDNADARQALDDALDGARRLGQMTLTLLDLGRLESSTMPMRKTKTFLRQTLIRVATDNRATAKSYGSRIEIASDADVVATIDEDLVVRALDNLVENAVRHAKRVTLSARTEGTDLVLEVVDDGPGIPPALQSRLFDKFVQVSSDGARGQNRGLGLTFVKLVAREHGGDVSVRCPTSGGTTFTLRFPAS